MAGLLVSGLYDIKQTEWRLSVIHNQYHTTVLLFPVNRTYAGLRWDFPLNEDEAAEHLIDVLVQATGATRV